jgi:protein-S-isoprenylcysteine O-methyltransferase Ste14
MIAKHSVITIVVGAGFGVLIWRHLPPAGWMQVAGICLLVIGFVFWTVARFQLGSSFSISAQARKLVTYGLYAKIRNPIYVFGSLVIAGVILILGRPLALLVFLIVIPAQSWRARKEASVLEAAFGEEYRTYRARTWF